MRSCATDAKAHAGAGATEHNANRVDQDHPPDDVISLLQESSEEKAKKILAAAVSLRNAAGRERKQTLTNLAPMWGKPKMREKVAHKWKTRSLEDVQ